MASARGVHIGAHGVDRTSGVRTVFKGCAYQRHGWMIAVPPFTYSPILRHDGVVIYVVDDDQSLRAAFTRLLSSGGHEVRSYASAEDFMLEIDSLSDGCLILDINLPGTDGFGLQKNLVSRGIRLPIVFVTGSDDAEIIARANNLGAVACLAKPVDGVVLLDAIRKALEIGEG